MCRAWVTACSDQGQGHKFCVHSLSLYLIEGNWNFLAEILMILGHYRFHGSGISTGPNPGVMLFYLRHIRKTSWKLSCRKPQGIQCIYTHQPGYLHTPPPQHTHALLSSKLLVCCVTSHNFDLDLHVTLNLAFSWGPLIIGPLVFYIA